MNIGFLSDQSLPHVYERIKSLNKYNHKILLFSWPTQNMCKTTDILLLPKPRSIKKINWLIQNIFQLRKYIANNNIEILHIMGIGSSVYGFFLNSTKIIIEHNGSDILVEPSRKPLFKLYYKTAYFFSDAIVQDSNISRDAGIKIGASEKNNEVIDIGVDFEIFNESVSLGVARKKYDISNKRKIVFCPRGLKKIYNNETIIKSIEFVKKYIPDVYYVFCGYYKYENIHENLISSMGIRDNVLFAGKLDRFKELPYFYRDADVVVSVPASDSSPLSVYEAMACKTDVIVSDLTWVNYKFNDLELLKVPVGDHEKLADLILKSFKNNNTQRIDELFQRVFNEINLYKEGEKLNNLYSKIMYG